MKKVEDREQQIETSYSEITQKLRKLENDYDQLKDIEVPPSREEEKKVKESLVQLEREHNIKVKEMNSKIRQLNGKIKELEGNITEIDEEEAELYLEIERRDYRIKEAQGNLSKLRDSAENNSESSRRGNGHSGSVFETELHEDPNSKKQKYRNGT